MRHSAWLNARPQPTGQTKPSPVQSRKEILIANDYDVDMPHVDVGQYILDYLWELGPTAGNGFGVVAIGHEAIRAWQDNVGLCLEAWEVRLLRRLSAAYAEEYNLAAEPDRPAPWATSGYGKAFAMINMRKSDNEMKEL